MIYAGKVPEVLGRYGEPMSQVRSDQRQIIYWLGSNGGLYRRERPWVTADGVRNATENDETATDSTLLAEEVTDILFEYSDGTPDNWASSWDGTQPGADGVTPIGPPRAIRMTLTLQIPVSRGEPVTRQVSHVIAVRSGPGTYTPPLLTAPPDAGGDGTGASTTGGSSPSTPSTGGSMGGSTGGSSAPSGGGSAPSPGGSTGGSGGTKTGGSSAPSGGSGGAKSGGSSGSGGKGGGR